MPGIGQEAQGQVSAGLAAQPLVTPAVGLPSSAVEQLVNSFRNGELTASDIIDRIGPVATAKKKADLQTLSEAVSPTAIQARQQLLKSTLAKSALEEQSANAQASLVQPSTELAATKIDREQADLKYGGGVSAYQQYAPIFGKPAVLTNEDGSPDYDSMGTEGNRFMRVMAQQNFARMMLEPDPSRKITGTTGNNQPFERMFNKFGQDITPHPDNPVFQQYNQIIKSTNDQIFGNEPGQIAPPAPSADAQPQAMVTPKASTDQGDSARAELVNLGMPGAKAAQLSDDDASSLLSSIQPKAAAAAPAAKPDISMVGSPVGSYEPGAGLILGPGKNVMTAKDIGEDLHKQKSYELWDQQKGFANSFETTVKKIDSVPVADQRSGKAKMNALDIALAESIIKMYDPGMAIREFKWDKLAEAQPYLEKLPNWRAEFLHTGSLTPEGRQRLIEMGYDNIAGKDSAVKPHIELAAQRARQSGLPVENVLNPEELRVLNNRPFTNRTSPKETPRGREVTIPGLGTGTYDSTTGIFTRTR